jgi:hypothetical protein
VSKVVFTGCSFTAGSGWINDDSVADCKEAPQLWVNLAHSNIDKLKNLDLVNYSSCGASNAEIFQQTVCAMGDHGRDIEYIFCQWTAMPRYRFSVGLELWPTHELIKHRRPKFTHDVNLSNGDSYSRKYIDDLINRLLALHHLHMEIVKVLEYCNTLQKLARTLDIKLYFINGLCPWDENYFLRLHNVLPDAYTEFTKKDILEIECRNDEDIFKLYDQIHNDYENAGGIDNSQWINLYSSMVSNKIDTNYDNAHPGINSNHLYYQQIKTFLKTQ